MLSWLYLYFIIFDCLLENPEEKKNNKIWDDFLFLKRFMDFGLFVHLLCKLTHLLKA